MWPWGHLAIGYLVYATYTRYRYDEHPAGLPAVVLAIATQFPDLIDKPLAYEVGVLPEGRALAHSLLVAVPLCALGLWIAWRTTGWRSRSGAAFAIGYATHLFGDAFWSLFALDLDALSFLVWPVLAAPDYDTTSFEGHLEQLTESAGTVSTGTVTPFAIEWVLFVLAVGLWIWHRLPPFPGVLAALRNGEGTAVQSSNRGS